MTIEISERTAESISEISKRYYFGLFEAIASNESDEYWFRDAIEEIDKKVKESRVRT